MTTCNHGDLCTIPVHKECCSYALGPDSLELLAPVGLHVINLSSPSLRVTACFFAGLPLEPFRNNATKMMTLENTMLGGKSQSNDYRCSFV